MYISSDTNIWIDLHAIGHVDHPFRLGYQYTISADTFRDELLHSQELRDQLTKSGLQQIEITDEEYVDALNYGNAYPALSLYDRFALAIAKKRNWVLLTGDMPLRKAAERESVEVHGLIWIYDQLIGQGKIQTNEFHTAMGELIAAVKMGQSRLPIHELVKR